MFMVLAISLVVHFYCCATADILTKLLQQCFLLFIMSVYRTIGPTLVLFFFKECIERASENSERFAKSSENQLIDELNSV